MLSELRALKEVQLLDMAVRGVDERLASTPAELAAVDAEIDAARARRKAATDAVDENGRARRRAEGELQDAESHVQKFQGQLLTASSNLEYTGLLKQIDAGKDKIGDVEERIINLMDEGDELDAALVEAKKEFGEAETRLEARKDRLRKEAEERKQERRRLIEERTRAGAGVPDALMAQYERIRRARHGLAVARVRESRCVACNVALRPQMYEEVRVGQTVLNCESCGRILYFEAPE